MVKRVDRLESVIGNICGKIDSVLSTVEAMEKSKNRRKANMGMILDGFITNPESNSYHYLINRLYLHLTKTMVI